MEEGGIVQDNKGTIIVYMIDTYISVMVNNSLKILLLFTYLNYFCLTIDKALSVVHPIDQTCLNVDGLCANMCDRVHVNGFVFCSSVSTGCSIDRSRDRCSSNVIVPLTSSEK